MTENILQNIGFYCVAIVYLIFPFVLFYKYGPKGKNKFLLAIFLGIIFGSNIIINHNIHEVIEIIYDYFFGFHPFWLNYTIQQIRIPLFIFFSALIIQYIMIYFYTNKKFLIVFLISQILLCTIISFSHIEYIILDHPTFFGPDEFDYENMKYE